MSVNLVNIIIRKLKEALIRTTMFKILQFAGADPGFQVRGGGAHLKKLRRAEGGAKIVGLFRVKITILRKKIIFLPILGGCVPGAPL